MVIRIQSSFTETTQVAEITGKSISFSGSWFGSKKVSSKTGIKKYKLLIKNMKFL